MTFVAELFADGEVVRESALDERVWDCEEIFAEERLAVSKAVAKRKNEFFAGRILARDAMAELGIFKAPLLNGADRAPCWPVGVVGSISHTSGYVAAVVARRETVLGIGLDVEQYTPMREQLWDSVAYSDEIEAARAGRDLVEAGLYLKTLFSVKEAAYKAQYCLSQRYLGFRAMRVTIAGESWTAEFAEDVSPHFVKGTILRGELRVRNGLVATACVIRTRGSQAIQQFVS